MSPMELRTIIHRAGDRSAEVDKTSCDRTHDVRMGTWYMRRCVAPLDSFVRPGANKREG
jgi:hypothetical protein